MELFRAEIPAGINYAAIELSASGTAVLGIIGKRIVLLSASIIANAAVNVKWQTSTGSVDLSGYAYLAQNGGYILPFNAGGWCQTAVSDSLNLNLSSGVAIGGMISYLLA
jgi:hypothetical protein